MAARLMLKDLVRELRKTNRTYKNISESPSYQYIMKQFRRNQVTGEQTCKATQEAEFMAHTYLSYLQSSRRAAEIKHEFHGRGERSVRSTADMVGFKLPHDPK